MAYLDLDNMFAAPAGSRSGVAAKVQTGFSALEWRVIALAKRDGLGSLGQPGKMSRAIRSLFGIGTASRLADQRLEALRRLAVHAWHRGFALPTTEIHRFIAAGFSEAQIETLVVSVTGLRAGGSQRSTAA